MRWNPGLIAFAALLAPMSSTSAQTRIVTGKVTDSLTTEPITSGQISIQGTTIATNIKDDGTFTLAAPARDVTLVVRSIGFKRRDIQLTAGQSSVQLALERDYFQLEAIVITGQATGIERKNLANAVATVNADQLVKAPTASVEQSLQGKLAGATISQNSGAPGGGLVVRLRGVTSIIGAFTPLYVVDGVIVSDVAVDPGTNFITQAVRGVVIAAAGENPINRIADLNPNDIESVEVLKGASASAIYGSKASNGVIIITTKRGRIGAPQFNLSQRFGLYRLSNKIGSRTFTSLSEATGVFGAIAATHYVDGQAFDHEEELAGNSPLSYETSGNVSGGTETGRYFASGLARHEGGIATGTFYDRQGARLNLDQRIGSRLTFSMSTDATRSHGDRGLFNNENNGSSYWSAFSVTPSFFDLRATCPDGTRQVKCKGGVYPFNPYGSSNPLHTAAVLQNRETVWRFLGTGRLDLDVVNSPQHHVRLSANGGTDIFTQKNAIFSPPALQFEAVDGLLGTSVISFSQNLNANINGNLVYTYRTGGGTSATTQMGIQYETRDLSINRTLGTNLVGGLNLPTSGTVIAVEASHELVKDFGLFAQEEFLTLGERLLLTAGARIDQSSNNSDAKKIFVYPKAAASYRWTPKIGPFDEIKFRAAVGQSGNQPQYSQRFTELLGVNITGSPAAQLLTQTAATDLRPERQREVEGGFDVTLLRSRANLEATAYEKRVTDLLQSRSLEGSAGFSRQIFNGGTLRTRGLELALSAFLIQSPSMQWNARTNFSMNRCKILALPVPPFPATGVRKEEGQSCTQFWGNDSLGSRPGDAALGTIGSRIVRRVADIQANFNLGVSNEVTYRRLRLYFLVDHQNGGWRGNSTLGLYDQLQNSVDYIVPRKAGALTGQQRRDAVVRTKQTLYYTLFPSGYTKLREVSLSFEVPPSLVHRIWSGARYVRLSASGRNLLTITDYTGTDPEAAIRPGSLASSAPGELWGYPPNRSFWFSLDLGF